MCSIMLYGGDKVRQVRFINWLIGADLVPEGNAGRCPITWHMVNGDERSEKLNVMVTYRRDETGCACHPIVYTKVNRVELDAFLDLVVSYAPVDMKGPLSAKAMLHRLGTGFMVNEVHVVLPVDMKIRASTRSELRVTQIPLGWDSIGRWLIHASHIVLFNQNPPHEFMTFERKDKVARRRIVIEEFQKDGMVVCILGSRGRWMHVTVLLSPMPGLSEETREWLKANSHTARSVMGLYGLTGGSVSYVDTRAEVVALRGMDM